VIPVPSMTPTEISVRTGDVRTNFNRTLFLYSVLSNIHNWGTENILACQVQTIGIPNDKMNSIFIVNFINKI
jgi:hypothetical protein